MQKTAIARRRLERMAGGVAVVEDLAQAALARVIATIVAL